jgi:cell division protein ZapE
MTASPTPAAVPASSPLRDHLRAAGIVLDPAQDAVAARLDALASALASWSPPRAGFLAGLFARRRPAAPRGLYVHGKVGRGKSMLMDAFFERARMEPRRRLHFHEFMAEVHDLIAEARKTVDGDPIPHVAKRIAASARLLCFDELHVTDIADAMILGRLFEGLWSDGVVVVATSNAQPRELYRNGLNRQLFLPFIDLLEAHMEVVDLASETDYRMLKLAGQPLYFTPLGAAADRAMREMFTRLTGLERGEPRALSVKGRSVPVPEAAQGVARFTFADLCAKPLGALDYLHIAHAFHTVLIEDIPCLTPARRNEARRFVNLIDTLYDNRVGLVASAEAEPAELYPEGDGAYLFERTVSRLVEMRSRDYLADRAARLGDAPTVEDVAGGA